MKTSSFLKKIAWGLVIFIGLSNAVSAQKIQVNGKVMLAADSSALPGVTIRIKNTNIGVVSNSQGNYTYIRVLNANDYTIQANVGDTLRFSFIGLEIQNIPVKERKLNVYLKEDEMVMEEATIVTGYGVTHHESAKFKLHSGMRIRGGAMPLAYTQNTEEYNKFAANRFLPALNEPLSTFSIDVDNAAYSNVRRFINQGTFPPVDAIRTEEFLNYFTYNYPAPQEKDPVSITTEVSNAPWNTQHKLVHIGIKAKEVSTDNLPASNLVFLIDVSGSMSDANKLPLLKSSLKLLVKQLRPQDRVAIVTYANHTKEVLASTPGSDKAKILDAIDGLYASGGTAGGDGIQRAYRVAESNFTKGGNNRIILATDGDFNIGISSPRELEKMIETKRTSGIYLTVLGFGMGNYKDNRMKVLAEKGNGNHAYIDNLTEAKKVLVNEFGGTLFTVAKDVKIQVEFNPAKVQAYRLIGYESRLLEAKDFNDDTKDAGEMGAGHSVTALYEIIPVGVKSNFAPNIDPLKYQKTEKNEKKMLTDSPELLTVKLRYKQPDSHKSSKMEVTVIDNNTPIKKSSENFRFSAAVAGVGMV